MKLAYSTNAYMRHTIHEAIDRVAGLGYRGVELMADVPHAWPESTTDDDVSHINSSLRRGGLSVSNINAFMMNAVQDFWHPSWIEPDETYRRRRIRHTELALTLAGKLGASCITTEPGGPLPEGKSRQWAMDAFVDGLREVLPHAEREGVALLVEPEPGLLIENAVQFLELAERMDSPAFGLNFDVGHFYCVADPLPETIDRLRQYTRHYHFEDIAATRVHEHLIPGRGAIDFRAVLQGIRRTGYDGWLTVELYPYVDDPDGAGAAALSYLTRLIQTA
ncbi:MAG: sugar phosphate isomerase/epimerase [Phycisphaerales bacterium]|nr:sugar phosphate isomerase/epimerase [Phycisphaerales bacterium]